MDSQDRRKYLMYMVDNSVSNCPSASDARGYAELRSIKVGVQHK